MCGFLGGNCTNYKSLGGGAYFTLMKMEVVHS